MNHMHVAKTILEQLGGNRFAAMTGAKDFVGGSDNLSFRIGRNSKGINKVRVTLTPMDDYTVEFFRVRKHTFTTLAKRETVYCDMLQDVFLEETGMYTHL